MQAIICESPGKFSYVDRQSPIPKPGFAQVKINRIGICGTDLHAYAGNQPFFTYPRILGHELSGDIVSIDNTGDYNLSANDKVVIIPYLHCGMCIACRSGKTNCCERISVIGVHQDGGMQEEISIPEKNLIKANHLSFESIAIVEPLAIGAHALRRAKIIYGETIAIVGCGPIGLGMIAQAKLLGAKVIAIDVNNGRLEIAKESFGADCIIHADKKPVEELLSFNNGDLTHAVFDATGSKSALESGIDYMCHGGRYILVGLNKGNLTYNHPTIHAKECTLMCSRNATKEDFENVIDLLSKGLFPVGDYITHKVEFKAMVDHFDSWLDPQNGVIKAMVTI